MINPDIIFKQYDDKSYVIVQVDTLTRFSIVFIYNDNLTNNDYKSQLICGAGMFVESNVRHVTQDEYVYYLNILENNKENLSEFNYDELLTKAKIHIRLRKIKKICFEV